MLPIRTSRTIPLLALLGLAGACAGDIGDVPATGDDEIVADEGAPLTDTGIRWKADLFPSWKLQQIEVAQNLDGSLALFGLTKTGSLAYAQQSGPNGLWGSPVNLGGTDLRDLAVARNADGRLEVFVRGGDDRIYHQWQTVPSSTSFGGWAHLGAWGVTDLAAGRHPDGKLVLFELGQNGYVYFAQQVQPNGGWGGWSMLPAVQVKRMRVAYAPNGWVTLFAVSTSGTLHQATIYPEGSTGGWYGHGGTSLADVEVGTAANGGFEVFVLGGDSHVYKTRQDGPWGAWSGWQYLGGGGVRGMAAGRYADGRLGLFEIGGDKIIHEMGQAGPNGSFWAWRPEVGAEGVAQVAAAANKDGRLELLALLEDGRVARTAEVTPSAGWPRLPPTPALNGGVGVSPGPYTAGQKITLNNAPVFGADCTMYNAYTIAGPTGTTSGVLDTPNGQVGFEYTPPVGGTYTITFTAECTEWWGGFYPRKSSASTSINVQSAPQPPQPPQPPPGQQETIYYQVIPRAQIWSGNVPYPYLFGQGISNGKLTGLQNPSPLLTISVVKAGGTNADCWTSKAVTLGPGQWTTSAQIQMLYGSSQPALPVGILACVQSDSILDAIGINIKYLHN
jgi:hypothetical protein